MAHSQRAVLAGSQRSEPVAGQRSGDVDPDEQATITVYLRPPEGAPDLGWIDGGPTGRPPMSREEFASQSGTADEDLAVIRQIADEHHLRIDAHDQARRAVTISGRLADLVDAFGAELALWADEGGHRYRVRTGPLQLPDQLDGVVTGVFGFDQRPQAEPHFRIDPNASVQYTPVQVAETYQYPPGVDGTGQCVALIELGGGFRTADLDAYFATLGLAAPTVTAVSVDGGANTPGTADGADGEVMLDIEMVGAIAPGATIAVYFAPNTDQGFLDAVTTAVHDTTHNPSVVSISWGGPESTWTAQAMNQMEQAFQAAAALGVTVTVASGDNGSTDGVSDGEQHVDFPASAPHALGCGGTTLRSGSETAWNELATNAGATGGGISAQFPVPAYQASAGIPVSANPGGAAGRGVPDVAGDADPDTGYTVEVDGQTTVIGGTSAVAPLWAALVALLNQSLGRPVGFVHPVLYQSPNAFSDITSGNNGAYSAVAGWDPCTGLGTPLGTAIRSAIEAAVSAPSTSN